MCNICERDVGDLRLVLAIMVLTIMVTHYGERPPMAVVYGFDM